MSHFKGRFEGASTFLTPEMAHEVIVPQKKNCVPQLIKQRYINSYLSAHSVCTSNFLVHTSQHAIKFSLFAKKTFIISRAQSPPTCPRNGSAARIKNFTRGAV